MLHFNKCPALHGSRLTQPKSLSLDIMYDRHQKVMLDFRAHSHAHTNATRLFMTDVQLTNHTDALVVDGLVMCLTADFSMTNDSTILLLCSDQCDPVIHFTAIQDHEALIHILHQLSSGPDAAYQTQLATLHQTLRTWLETPKTCLSLCPILHEVLHLCRDYLPHNADRPGHNSLVPDMLLSNILTSAVVAVNWLVIDTASSLPNLDVVPRHQTHRF